MHILYILDFYKPNKGGIENLVESLVNHFYKEHKISIITFKFDDSLPDIEKKLNVTIYRIKAKNLIFYTFKAYKFAKSIISDVNVIHSHTFYSALVGARLGKNFGKKTLIHVHGFFGEYRDNLIEDEGLKKKLRVFKFKLLEKIISSKKPYKFICVSRFVFDVLRFRYGVDFSLLEVVYNGIDYDYLRGLISPKKIEKIKTEYGLSNSFVFSFFGRIEKVKGWSYYLKVISDLLKNEFKEEKVKFLFVIFGNFSKFIDKMFDLGLLDNKEEVLNKLEKGLVVDLDNFLIVPGLDYKEIPNWLKISDVFVFPSYMESFGLIGLEASVLDIPIVASSGGAIPEVVFGNVNFFQEGSKEELRQSIIDAKNGKFYEKIPDRNLGINQTISKIEGLYLN